MAKAAVKSKVRKADVKLPLLQPERTVINNAALIPVEDAKPKDRRAEHLAQYATKPGQVLNPKGRPKGSRNKLAESFVADVLQDWEANGAAAIQRVRVTDPSTYLRVVAGLVPKEFNLNGNREQSLERFLEQFTDEQLAEFERAVAAITAIPVGQG